MANQTSDYSVSTIDTNKLKRHAKFKCKAFRDHLFVPYNTRTKVCSLQYIFQHYALDMSSLKHSSSIWNTPMKPLHPVDALILSCLSIHILLLLLFK